MKISVLCENYTMKMGILAEFGLSLLIESGDNTILFDSGLTGIFVDNAKALDIDIKKADAFVLSHGHHDHAGGLRRFSKIASNMPIYAHSDAIKFMKEDCPQTVELLKQRIVENCEPKEILENVFLSGTVELFEPIRTFTATGEPIIDPGEQFLIIKEPMGIYIILGCSHPGVLNCVRHVKRMFSDEKILSIIGGMHLSKTSKLEIQEIIGSLKALDVNDTTIMHCTGIDAYIEFKNEYKDNCRYLSSGENISF